MKSIQQLFLIFFLSFFALANAQEFVFNENCQRAYSNIIALKLDSGKYQIEQERLINPNNYLPLLLENYIDFLTVYTSGSLVSYEKTKQNFDTRIKFLKKGDVSSPYNLYCQAEVHTQSAVLHIKFGEYIATIFDVRKALKKLEENQKLFPDFMPNKKSLGMLYTILGSIPQQYQGGLDFIGLKGEVNKGLSLLKAAVKDESHPFQHEAATIYAFMLLHIQNDAEGAWNTLIQHQFSAQENSMDAYSYGHIGIYGKNNDAGIAALLKKPKSKEYHPFPLTDFLLGIGKTYRQDEDANTYFQKFLEANKGEDYIKSAWHKMAWNALIIGNNNLYINYINKVGISGREVIDTDKQAKKEWQAKSAPNPILLKARLLTDGNYLSRAIAILNENNVNSFKNRFEKTEYFYRLARVYDKSQLVDKAIKYYQITITNGKNVPFYYAANSAYLLGFLLESRQDKMQALKYYQLCLELNGYEYENSIHQKAEAGINRLN